MRIITLSWEYPPRIVGGISRHVYDLCQAMKRAGIEIDVITSEYPDAPAFEESGSLRIHRVAAGKDMSNILDWVKRFNESAETAADAIIEKAGDEEVLIHAHDWLAQPAAKSLKHRHCIPIAATIHATEHGRNNGIRTDLQRGISHLEWELAYEAWRVIVCSFFMKDEVGKVLNVPKEKMDVVYNGVEAGKFEMSFDKSAFRSAYANEKEKLIFFVGRMAREKGAHLLIDAFRRVLDSGEKAKLVIAGGGNRTDLKYQAEELGLSDKVYFTGYIDDDTLLKLYNVVDVAVFPSLYEPFGIVALEAMAARVPVVVSDAGGLREVVDHGVTGYVTWAGNVDSLAWGITQVLHNAPVAKSIADSAYIKATEVFNWDRIAARTIEVYERILDEYRAGNWKRGTD